jgi:NAD(P)-dependent dehydrogenase (short-subunit alcohol dehydrogenase family)
MNPQRIEGTVLQLDVTDEDEIRAAADAASDVELVFNNAGVALPGGIDSAVLDRARREMEVNYFGPLHLLPPGAGAGQEGRRGHRQHRLDRRPDQRPLYPDLQRLEGCAPFTDPGRSFSPRGAGHLGLRRLRGPR